MPFHFIVVICCTASTVQYKEPLIKEPLTARKNTNEHHPLHVPLDSNW